MVTVWAFIFSLGGNIATIVLYAEKAVAFRKQYGEIRKQNIEIQLLRVKLAKESASVVSPTPEEVEKYGQADVIAAARRFTGRGLKLMSLLLLLTAGLLGIGSTATSEIRAAQSERNRAWEVTQDEKEKRQVTQAERDRLVDALRQEPSPGQISGVVMDLTGNPLSGYTVRLVSNQGQLIGEIITGPDGKYLLNFGNVELPRPAVLEFLQPGRPVVRREVVLTKGGQVVNVIPL
jgi:hypothetical protein